MNQAFFIENLKKRFDLNCQDSRVLVVGLGVTGYSVAKFLKKTGIKYAVVDSRNHPPMIDELFKNMPDVPTFCGEFKQSVFQLASHLVVSPGVSLEESMIQDAIKNGAVILSDIDLFACATEEPVIAITGSNGKSTVTTMMGDIGNRAGITTAIGGNLGIPALDLLDDKVGLYVLELSSFQLERTTALNAKAAVVLNVTPDHLDRHMDMNEYARQKARVYRGDGVVVLNLDDEYVKTMHDFGRKVIEFSLHTQSEFYLDETTEQMMFNNQVLMKSQDLPLEGTHNVSNALAAIALSFAIGIEPAIAVSALKVFKGLPHRMQKVTERNGVVWVNDSKATNIGACVAALEGYQKKVILIAGGDGKGADMTELAPVIKAKSKAVIVMGKDAKLIELAINGDVPVFHAGNMKQAVALASSEALKGDTVLLSPACASLDQYRSYADRGQQFADAVMGLPAC